MVWPRACVGLSWPSTGRCRFGLIKEGLDKLTNLGAKGCVVLGDPAYYGRFGFSSDHALRYGDVPPEYFQSLVLGGESGAGEVTYHAGFEAA